MSKEKKKDSKNKEFSNNISVVWKELKKLFNGKVDLILVVFSTILVGIMKYFGYVYISGKFSVYKIDRSYIDASSDNVFFAIVQVITLIIFLCFLNILYYSIGTLNNKFKETVCYIFLWMFEMIGFSLYCCYSSDVSFSLFWQVTDIKQKISFALMALAACLGINIYAILALVQNKIEPSVPEGKDKQKKCKNKKNILPQIFVCLIIIFTLGSTILFDFARSVESNRQDYKVLFMEDKTILKNDFVVKCNNHVVYPVVYETQDYYIAIRLLYINDCIKKDCDYQIIVPKCGQETLYITNIYRESEYIKMDK